MTEPKKTPLSDADRSVRVLSKLADSLAEQLSTSEEEGEFLRRLMGAMSTVIRIHEETLLQVEADMYAIRGAAMDAMECDAAPDTDWICDVADQMIDEIRRVTPNIKRPNSPGSLEVN